MAWWKKAQLQAIGKEEMVEEGNIHLVLSAIQKGMDVPSALLERSTDHHFAILTPRTRLSSEPRSATLSKPLPFETWKRPPFTRSTPCPSSTLELPTVSRALSTPRSSESDLASPEPSTRGRPELPLLDPGSRTERGSTPPLPPLKTPRLLELKHLFSE